jgi:hypothetical protein
MKKILFSLVVLLACSVVTNAQTPTQKAITLFPNPVVSSIMKITAKDTIPQTSTVTIWDLRGRKITQRSFGDGSINLTLAVDKKHLLHSATYVLQVKTPTGRVYPGVEFIWNF